MIHRIHARDDGEENLRGADVRRGLLAADVLLARLEREAQTGTALRIFAHADEPARHRALEAVARGEERRVRSAITQRHAEALRVPDHDVRAEFAGRRQQCEREQIRRDNRHRIRRVRLLVEGAVIMNRPVRRGILHQRREDFLREVEGVMVPDDHLDAQSQRACTDDLDRLRMTRLGNEERMAILSVLDAVRHRHRLSGGGAFVEHRGVRDLHAGQVRDERLEIQQRFETSLRNLRLIRRVLRVPAGVLEDVPLDDAGRDRVVVTHPDE